MWFNRIMWIQGLILIHEPIGIHGIKLLHWIIRIHRNTSNHIFWKKNHGTLYFVKKGASKQRFEFTDSNKFTLWNSHSMKLHSIF